ncbi:hypothetical protein B7P43_G17001 [Cryptotermes secundus]|uniref:Reverse transcriptase Ty1/copia-type domain-containing protein n=1 Tax=Cryptotermes secundus TaxID=105785 RepID=A0A2J7PGN8_9NEOP|nr:hypothetical protein B7P43_G17001 [Cryptotermes secundus]
MHSHQLDVQNAFLHGVLKEEIFMRPPTGLNIGNDKVCRLNKTLYGLKQAPMEWNKEFNNYVQGLGFKQSEYDKCLYVRNKDGKPIYILLYVDDFIIASKDLQEMTVLKNKLKEKFKVKDLGNLKYFLGIRIIRKEQTMHLSQAAYVGKLLEKFGMSDCHQVKTPMEQNPPRELEGDCIVGQKPYKELVGCLMYLMLNTRPDLSSAINFYSCYQSNATEAQWLGLKRILRYLKGTADIGLLYDVNTKKPLVSYVDADWANDYDRKSISGFLIQVYGNCVGWVTRKQNTVALSSTEAEYVALASAVTEVLWMKGLLVDFQICDIEPVIYEDNQSCIALLSRWEHKRLKHVDVKYNFVRDCYMNKSIDVQYVPTTHQIADILTKGLSYEKFNCFRSMSKMVTGY